LHVLQQVRPGRGDRRARPMSLPSTAATVARLATPDGAVRVKLLRCWGRWLRVSGAGFTRVRCGTCSPSWNAGGMPCPAFTLIARVVITLEGTLRGIDPGSTWRRRPPSSSRRGRRTVVATPPWLSGSCFARCRPFAPCRPRRGHRPAAAVGARPRGRRDVQRCASLRHGRVGRPGAGAAIGGVGLLVSVLPLVGGAWPIHTRARPH
jgi:hypothetical protein